MTTLTYTKMPTSRKVFCVGAFWLASLMALTPWTPFDVDRVIAGACVLGIVIVGIAAERYKDERRLRDQWAVGIACVFAVFGASTAFWSDGEPPSTSLMWVYGTLIAGAAGGLMYQYHHHRRTALRAWATSRHGELVRDVGERLRRERPDVDADTIEDHARFALAQEAEAGISGR